jgi:hypothetical protein
MTSSSLEASDFPGAGVGARILGGAGAIRTDIMVMVTHTVTAMAMEATRIGATATDMDTATGPGPELASYSAGSLGLVIITGLLTASWDRRRVEQFARSSKTAARSV